MVRICTTWYKCLFCTRVFPVAPQLIEHRKKFHLEQFREYRLAKKLKKSNIGPDKQNCLNSEGEETNSDKNEDTLSVTESQTSTSSADSSLVNGDTVIKQIELVDKVKAKDEKKVKVDLNIVKKEDGYYTKIKSKIYSCDSCTKEFRNRWGLTMHKEVHDRNRYKVRRHVPIKRERRY